MRLVRHLVTGLLLGLGLGAVARGFMALLTEDPQFSWEGTGFILGLFGLAGLALGAVWDLRLRRRSRWWKVLALPAALLFFGPGSLMLPGVLGLALVASPRRWVRACGAVVIGGWVVTVGYLTMTSDEPFTVRTALGFVVMFGVCVALAAGARLALTGWSPSRSAQVVASGEPERDRGQGPDHGSDGRSAEDPLDLHHRGVEQGLAVGLVGQRGDGGVVLVQPDRGQ